MDSNPPRTRSLSIEFKQNKILTGGITLTKTTPPLTLNQVRTHSSHYKIKSLAIGFLFLIFTSLSGAEDLKKSYIIEYEPGQQQSVVSSIEAAGGQVVYLYQNVNAISATLPTDSSAEGLQNSEGVIQLYRDKKVKSPKANEVREFSKKRAEAAGFEYKDRITLNRKVSHYSFKSVFSQTGIGKDVNTLIHEGLLPKDYLFNLDLTGAQTLHEEGYFGDGEIVVVIDSGVANNPQIVPSLAGSVIGGENLVENQQEVSATSTRNDFHGTAVGTTIAGHTGFLIPSDDVWAQSLLEHAPESVVANFQGTGQVLVPLIGTAPAAQIYAIKVFHSQEEFAPDSRILAAMDRALTLRLNYNAIYGSSLHNNPQPTSGSGSEEDPYVYNALKVSVVNMSLGGPTLYPGNELKDQLASQMYDAGIVLVASAGNSGPTAITVGSPATATETLAVGAVSTATHERVILDISVPDFPGIGWLLRPTDAPQMAFFSSRGPNANGELDPDVVSTGLGTLAQSSDGSIGFASGTSFSSPEVSGGIALLRQTYPESQARSVRDSVIYSADSRYIPSAGIIDQGYGMVNYPAAREALAHEIVPFSLLPTFNPGRYVANNLASAEQKVYRTKKVQLKTSSLAPGEVYHINLRILNNVDQVVVKISDLELEENQNALLGDHFYLAIQDAVTSDYYPLLEELVFDNQEFTIPNPQPGVMRIAVMAASSNVGQVKARVRMQIMDHKPSLPSAKGFLSTDQEQDYVVNVPKGTRLLESQLDWARNWAFYPTDDLELFLISPSGEFYDYGATLASPERVIIDNPEPGEWLFLVYGYEVNDVWIKSRDGKRSKRLPKAAYSLRIDIDGKTFNINGDKRRR